MNSIGFGVIGLGRIGAFHADSLRNAISGAIWWPLPSTRTTADF